MKGQEREDIDRQTGRVVSLDLSWDFKSELGAPTMAE